MKERDTPKNIDVDKYSLQFHQDRNYLCDYLVSPDQSLIGKIKDWGNLKLAPTRFIGKKTKPMNEWQQKVRRLSPSNYPNVGLRNNAVDILTHTVEKFTHISIQTLIPINDFQSKAVTRPLLIRSD